MSSPTMTTRQLISLGLAVLVITSSFVPAIEARKIGGRKSSGSSSKSKPSGGSRPSTHYNPVSLSYPSSHSARPAPPKAPSAPQQPQQPAVGWNTNSGNNQAGAANSRPIGWNVNNNNNQGIPKATAPQQSNAAPPPYSPNFPPQQGHAPAGAPPPYSNAHPNGPPPAYSPQQPQYNPNQAYHPPQGSPPAYSPHAPAAGYPQQPGYAGHGYQQPGYQQPAYGHQQPGYPGGYPQQQYPGGGGGYGGYPQPGGGGFGGYGQQPVINNYYQKGGGGNGLTNALLLGVGGLSLYSALKPGETKVIYINNSTNPEDARTVSQNGTHVLVSDNNNMTVATPLAPFPPDCSQFMGMPLPPQYFNQTANLSGNSSVSGAVTTPTPLAPFPETTTIVAGQMETTTLTGEIIGNATEAGETTTMTTMVAPPAAGGLNETSPTYVPASMVNATVASPPPINSPPVPIIPAECIPFMTGQVVPTNYTGPGPFVGAPANLNPVQGGPPPQWPQANPGAPPAQQQQQSAGLNSVPVEGVQKSGAVNNYAVSVTVFVVAFACSVL